MAPTGSPLSSPAEFETAAEWGTFKIQSLDNFSPEIILLIFEKLAEDGPFQYQSASFLPLQLVSRKINTLVTPFRYREIVLSESLLKFRPSRQAAIRNISLHTRRLTIRHELSCEWDHVSKILRDCSRLESIRWDLRMPMPRNISQAISQKVPRVALHLDSYLCPVSATEEEELAASYPPANIESITFVAAFGPDVNALHKMLVGASNLQSINMTSQRGIFNPASGTLPAIRTLEVSLDRWKFEKNDVFRIWNFSNLENLHIRDLDSFLRAVQPEHFQQLRSFKGFRYDCRTRDPTYYCHQEETALLLNQFLAALPLLEQIDVSTMLSKFDIASLTNKHDLRTLRLCEIDESYQNRFIQEVVEPKGYTFRAHIRGVDPPFEDLLPTSFPALSPTDVAVLQKSCPAIEKLDLGINRFNDNASPQFHKTLTTAKLIFLTKHVQFLQAISTFPHLRNLTLRTQTIGTELEEINLGRNLDREFVESAWIKLRSPEKPLPLANLKVEISQLIYLDKSGGSPDALYWKTLEASGHPRRATRTFCVSWKDDQPKERMF